MVSPSSATTAPAIPNSIDEAAWRDWKAVDRATLCFVIEDGRVLLIRKKRGLGAGKINGPGGKLEGGETPKECAARETQEELLIVPTGLREAGRLKFQFTDGYSIDVTVFRADGALGEPTETDEAIPIWAALDAVPFGEMWQDDELWFPYLLAETPFLGRFIFDGDRMVDYDLRSTK